MAILRCSKSRRTTVFAIVLAVVGSLAFSAGSWDACINDPDAAQKATQFSDNPFPLLNGPTNGPYNADASRTTCRTFAASPEMLTAILNVPKDFLKDDVNTSGLQKAIGTGLGKASNAGQVPLVNLGG
jgi:hypothetical protein